MKAIKFFFRMCFLKIWTLRCAKFNVTCKLQLYFLDLLKILVTFWTNCNGNSAIVCLSVCVCMFDSGMASRVLGVDQISDSMLSCRDTHSSGTGDG